MANQVIVPTALVHETETAQLIAAGAAVNAADTFEADVKFNSGCAIFVENVGGGTAAITIDAGDNPPSALATKGAKAFTIVTGAGFSKLIFLEPGRHIKSSGKITGSVATNNCKITVLQLPRGVSGGY